MELREEVTVADVEEAMRLIKAATYAAAVDPETGLIDMEQLIVGMGAARRKRMKELEQLIQDILAERGDQQLNQELQKTLGHDFDCPCVFFDNTLNMCPDDELLELFESSWRTSCASRSGS